MAWLRGFWGSARLRAAARWARSAVAEIGMSRMWKNTHAGGALPGTCRAARSGRRTRW
jgi:hypothetical protein